MSYTIISHYFINQNFRKYRLNHFFFFYKIDINLNNFSIDVLLSILKLFLLI